MSMPVVIAAHATLVLVALLLACTERGRDLLVTLIILVACAGGTVCVLLAIAVVFRYWIGGGQ